MAGISVTGHVQFTDNTGRFVLLAGEAAHQAAQDLVDAAAEMAQDGAPSGPGREDYGRRPKLKPNVRGEMIGPKVGKVVADTGHAASQEDGAKPHVIPNAFGRGPVKHPGNRPQPYIRPAIRRLRARADGIVKRAYARLG